MGFFSGTKKVAGQIFNFRVGDWLNTDYHKNAFGFFSGYTKSLFYPDKSLRQETFEEAMERLQITEQDLVMRKKEFSRLFIIFMLFSIFLFVYTLFITIKYKNLYSFTLGIAVTILSLTKTFMYHFWLTQLNKKKLGLTFKEWLEQ